jgi:hypothetical protein
VAAVPSLMNSAGIAGGSPPINAGGTELSPSALKEGSFSKSSVVESQSESVRDSSKGSPAGYN